MLRQVISSILTAGLVTLAAGNAVANTAKKTHCEKAGKAVKAKDEAACTKAGGTWAKPEEKAAGAAETTSAAPAVEGDKAEAPKK